MRPERGGIIEIDLARFGALRGEIGERLRMATAGDHGRRTGLEQRPDHPAAAMSAGTGDDETSLGRNGHETIP